MTAVELMTEPAHLEAIKEEFKKDRRINIALMKKLWYQDWCRSFLVDRPF